ncbi:MAG: hypothetical protein KAI28_12510 [Sphingomonadales bacterium]|nr:hypothetical protein [Sphingomonadales bacterium]
MPQMDISTFAPQLIWLLITFGLLYLVMARSALPRIGRVLEDRANKIADDLDEAGRLKEDSAAVEADYEKALAEAKANANAYLKDARDALQADIDARKGAVEADLSKKVAKAEAKIAKAKTKALEDVEGIAVDACKDIVQKLSGFKVTDAEASKAVKAEVAAVLNGGNA